MKPVTSMSLIMLLWVAGCSKQASDPQSAQDMKAFQGTWNVMSAESNGEPPPPGLLNGATFVFEGNNLTLMGKRGTFQIDASVWPRRIEFVRGASRQVGIYELANDQLRFCVGPADSPPTSFTTSPRTDHSLFVLKRAAQ